MTIDWGLIDTVLLGAYLQLIKQNQLLNQCTLIRLT